MIPSSAAYNAALAQVPLFPKYQVLSYNLNTNDGGDTWGAIIDGTYGQTPIDLTVYVSKVDYTFDRLSITLVDDSDLSFHPDAGVLRAAIKSGRAIRLREGFENLATSEWLWTFTGTVEGTYAWTYERAKPVTAQFTVYNRANNQAWKRRNVTSQNFTIGSDWSSMFFNIVKGIMLMSPAEIVVPEPWGVLFDKNSNQVANYPPWDALEQLLWGISARPFFNGKGELDSYSLTQDRVTQVLADESYVVRYDARDGGSETINKVILTYLSNTLSRVNGADQVLGTAIITAGFLLNNQSVNVYYSDERKVRSDNPRFVVKKSVNQTFLEVGTEGMTKLDEFHSRVDVTVPIWAGLILLVLLASYVTIAAGVNFLGDLIGAQLAMALLLVIILLFMSTIGTGQYEVWGTPYEMVYLEKQFIAMKNDIEFWQERELDIRNDFVSTEIQARPLVLTQLHYEVMKEQPRSLVLRYDPRIEQGDIIQLSTQVRVYVDSVKRGLARGSADPLIMNVDGWRTVL